MCHIHLCHPDDSYEKCLAFKPLDTQTQTLRKNKRKTDQATVSLSVVNRNNILFLSYSKSSKLPGPFLSLSKEICGVW